MGEHKQKRPDDLSERHGLQFLENLLTMFHFISGPVRGSIILLSTSSRVTVAYCLKVEFVPRDTRQNSALSHTVRQYPLKRNLN